MGQAIKCQMDTGVGEHACSLCHRRGCSHDWGEEQCRDQTERRRGLCCGCALHGFLSGAGLLKVTSMFRRVEELLGGLHTFEHTSPLNRANLEVPDSEKPLMPSRIVVLQLCQGQRCGQVQWFSAPTPLVTEAASPRLYRNVSTIT